MAQAIIAAEYTNGSKTRLPTLAITRIENGQRTYLETHDVIGKREARAVAKALGATPWNF
jgi:O6-methylguanine-DNA--protein-cysteine methyltransferase